MTSAEIRARNHRSLFTVMGVTVIAVMLSLAIDGPERFAALSNFFFWAAFGAACLGILRNESFSAPHFTAWDQSAALLIGSKIAALVFFSDAPAPE